MWRSLLRAVGIQVADPLGPPDPLDPAAVAAGRYVFVHDDDRSPFAAVLVWMEEAFDLTRAEAVAYTRQANDHGWTALGPFRAQDVGMVLRRARAEAERLSLVHLRFGTGPPDEAPAPQGSDAPGSYTPTEE